jgi:hypothetical protein
MVLRKTIIVCTLLSMVGCANNTFWYNPPAQIMSEDDLNHFGYDCEHVAEQRAILAYQLANIPAYETKSLRRALILRLLNQMPSDCGPVQTAAVVGCTHVREDMTSGSAQATVCNSDPNRRFRPLERPVINRWDPLVDTK